jgi:hypothetical protein
MVRKMEMAREMEIDIAEGMGDGEIKNRRMKHGYSVFLILTQPVSICNANRILQHGA